MYARIGGKPQITQVYAAQKACMLDGLRADRVSAEKDCALAQTWSNSGFGADTGLHGDSLESTAFGLLETGDITGAKDLFEQAKRLYGTDPANRMRVGRVDSELAGIALLEGKPEVARELLPGAIAGLRTRAFKVPPLIAETRLLLACTQSPGPRCAGDLRARIDHDLAEVAAREDPMLLWVRTLLARTDLLQGRAVQARAELEQAIRRSSGEIQPAHPRRLVARLWLADATARAGDCSGARAQVQAARAIVDANHLAAQLELAPALAVLRKPVARCGVLLN
jgi:serine/threonine-protein kinase